MFNKKQFGKMMWQFNADRDKLSIQMDKLSKQLYDLENQKKKLQSDLIMASDILSTREWEYHGYISSDRDKDYKKCSMKDAIILRSVVKDFNNRWYEFPIMGHEFPYCLELNDKISLIIGGFKYKYLVIDRIMFTKQIDLLKIKIDTFTVKNNVEKLQRIQDINMRKHNIQTDVLITVLNVINKKKS